MIRRLAPWVLVILAGFLVVALVPALVADPATGAAPLWLAPAGYALVLVGVAGVIWTWIVAVRAARRPGDDRYDPSNR